MKKIKNILKKFGKFYIDSVSEYYKPLINSKINPLI